MAQSNFDQLESLVATIKEDYLKATSGNKAAGTRVRVGMQQIKAKAQDIRLEISELKS